MGLYDFAKCSLLESMTATTLALPLWQTGVVVLCVLFGQIAGRLVGFRIGQRRLPLNTLRAIALATGGAILVAVFVVTVVSGLQCVLFLLRMVKDGAYCTYFGASNELANDQMAALTIAVVGNVVIVTLAVINRRSYSMPSRLGYEICSALCCVACVIAKGFPLIAWIAIVHSLLVLVASHALRAERC